MKKLVFLSLIVIAFADVKAQRNFHAGYVVLNSRDTLHGFIDYLEWHKNPTSILFTKAVKMESVRYTSTEVQYFEIAGAVSYQKFGVNISLDPILFSDLSDKSTANKNDSVFLKVIHTGKNVSLYSYKDDLKLRWYVKQTHETTPKELLNSMYRVNGQVMNEKQYRQQWLNIAANYLPADEKIAVTIRKSGYTKGAFLSICYALNGVDKESIVSKKQSPFSFFAGAGLNVGSISFTGDNMFEGISPSDSYFPVFGVGVDIYPIPAVGRLFIRNELGFTQFKSQMQTEPKQYYSATEQYFFKFKQTNTALLSQLSYRFYNRPGLKCFAGAGVGFNFSQYPTNERTMVRKGFNEHTTTNDNYLDMLKFWMSFAMKAGVAVKSFEVCVAYFPKTAISDYANFSLDNSSTQIQLNYIFKRKKISS